MELKFEQDLDYQREAIDSVLNLFKGQEKHENASSVDVLDATSNTVQTDLFLSYQVIANHRITISDEQWQDNLTQQQKRAGFQKTSRIADDGKNFSIEMETGTGKTYVYLRTIFELNRQYGWKKFVIVVPSVAIREGVWHSLKTSQKHFQTLFDNPSVGYTVYQSSNQAQLKQFATSSNIEILLMNIDAFAKKDQNVINIAGENGIAMIRYIQATNPIVIIDEPQNMETDLRQKAIENLKPLFTLRYSATHKKPYNPIFSLNPVQAYEKNLVKRIEVLSVWSENSLNGAYLVLKEIKQDKKSLKAKIELHINDPKGMKKASKLFKLGDDLFETSKENKDYQGLILQGIDFKQEQVCFSNGLTLSLGDDPSKLKDEIQKEQIRQTITEHLKKEQTLTQDGIKVLSLFFIDKVDNYRNGGKFSQWFEEIYQELTKKDPVGVHNGYFSQDNTGRAKDTSGSSQKDHDTYRLIMQDKEALLDINNPLRFIFSHSALKEGWDNPNVFQICTLNDTVSQMKKRQEIGRGLRLPVNQNGERIRDQNKNILTVIANEQYDRFASQLQKEIQEDCGIEFDKGHIKKRENRKTIAYREGWEADPNFQAIWDQIKHKTNYRVSFEAANLIKNVQEKIAAMPIEKAQIRSEKNQLILNDEGVAPSYLSTECHTLEQSWAIPDLLHSLEQKTGLTRSSLCQILKDLPCLKQVRVNPQYFIEQVSEQIHHVLQEMMVAGIQYQKIENKTYDMSLFQPVEIYQNDDNNFTVNDSEKTIYQKGSQLALDSQTEVKFARDCDSAENVQFYFKLPSKFKIPTPLGQYNPDWAVVYQKGEAQQIYFVAETKNTGTSKVDKDKLRLSEHLKINSAKQHFECLKSVRYAVVQELADLEKSENS